MTNRIRVPRHDALQGCRSIITTIMVASIGRRAGVASILGINISGFLAWWMWRTIYLSKLPRLEKKLRVALDWTLDLMFSKDLCRFMEVRREDKISVTSKTL